MKACESAVVAVLALSASAQGKSLAARAVGLETRISGSQPCAVVADAVAAYGSANPDAEVAYIPAELAYSCAEVVPNKKQPALDFVDSLKPVLEFQSDVDSYLPKPPAGYLYPGVDLRAELAQIRDKVQNGSYNSEFDFQLDIYALTIAARDGHLQIWGDLFQFFGSSFSRGAPPLVVVSADGISMPQVYSAYDLINIDSDSNTISPVTSYNPSPITKIDGLDVVSWLLEESATGNDQDPDANWNTLFCSLTSVALNGQAGSFQSNGFYPGPSTNFTFANGTTQTYENTYTANPESWLDITTGDDIYNEVIQTASPATATTAFASASASASAFASASASASALASASASGYPAPSGLPYFPNPVITEGSNSYGGYYLTKSGLTDVAVLKITQFEPASADSNEFLVEIQDVMQKFFAAAPKAGKTKLIIDLQGNPGGIIEAGLETFAQLFPQTTASTSSNLRAHLGSFLATSAAAYQVKSDTDAFSAFRDSFDYEALLSTNGQPFKNYTDFYGPYVQDHANFSNFFEDNYFDPNYGYPINITGTNNRQNFKQPFVAENIILLYDGNCASTCTVFSEHMKSQAGVQAIAIGGRPQTGPMQGVGGIKGSEIYDSSQISAIANLIDLGVQEKFGTVKGTVFENFDQGLALTRTQRALGVNGHNQFRIGDPSSTPLQYVYEASDCRIWYTPEMLYDETFLWNRVAEIAFQNRTNGQFNSPYCVKGSTGHPTSISGGWKKGTLGPQTPPANAPFSLQGWPLNGTVVTNTGKKTGGKGTGKDEVGDKEAIGANTGSTATPESKVLDPLRSACTGYSGEGWMIKVICAYAQSQ